MHKLLIVDDEAWTRERLKNTIEWTKLGIEVVGEASDGEEALDLTGKLFPDIIITDIRMPGIDGLEFIGRIRGSKNDAKVIIISGYGDFDYAQKAIKLGAFDYILKPIEDEALINVIKQCIEKLKAESSRKQFFQQASRQVRDSLVILKEKFFVKLVNGHFTDEKQMLSELESLCLKIEGYNYICFVVQIDDYHKVKTDEKWNKNLIQFVVCNIVKDFADKLAKSELFFLPSGEVVCVVISENNDEKRVSQVMSISKGIRNMIRKVLGYSVTIGIGRTYSTLFDVSISYKEAMHAVQYKDYFGRGKIYDIRSLEVKCKPCFNKCYNIDALLNSIRLGNKVHALNNLETLMNEIRNMNNEMPPLDLKFVYIDIVNSILKIVLECSNHENFSGFCFSFLEQLNKLQTIDEMHEWMKETVMVIVDQMENFSASKKRKVVERALDFIEKHYMEPITLNVIADKLGLNASYFCTIFKEETGDSFTKYLMKLRVDKAIELMNDPTMKIYEIADRVGYVDVQYFTKVFKSIQGVTPMYYREKVK